MHSYGDVYVLMSYKGKEPSDERYTNVLVSEAYEVLMMAFDMLDTVAEMREKASTSLKDIDLQIGIHTGKILGGLIGKNFVRYDIFGQDVHLTKKIMEDTPSGTIRMSETTHNMLFLNQFIYITFDFQPYTDVVI